MKKKKGKKTQTESVWRRIGNLALEFVLVADEWMNVVLQESPPSFLRINKLTKQTKHTLSSISLSNKAIVNFINKIHSFDSACVYCRTSTATSSTQCSYRDLMYFLDSELFLIFFINIICYDKIHRVWACLVVNSLPKRRVIANNFYLIISRLTLLVYFFILYFSRVYQSSSSRHIMKIIMEWKKTL